jgi:hypothetical protein
LKKRGVLIIECIGKKEGKREGELLARFLELVLEDRLQDIELVNMTSKSELSDFLPGGKNVLGRYANVHISAHGAPEDFAIELPKGTLEIGEMEKGCFKGKTLTLSSCSMGRIDVARELFDWTGVRNVVAPLYDVYFDDSALWFLNFYYLLLTHGYQPRNAVTRCNALLNGLVKGGFRMYAQCADGSISEYW